MKNQITSNNQIPVVSFGKYKGELITSISLEYALWQKVNGNAKFYSSWLDNNRFNKHLSFFTHKSPDGRFLERKLSDGTFVFKYAINGNGLSKYGTRYYLVDADGNYMRDLTSFGAVSVKQGAIDETQKDWITLSPSGNKMIGKMIVAPYCQHFTYETYQVNN